MRDIARGLIPWHDLKKVEKGKSKLESFFHKNEGNLNILTLTEKREMNKIILLSGGPSKCRSK